MKALNDTKIELKNLLPEGIDIAIKGIKNAISEGTDKYNDLLLLESRYQDISRQLIQGVLSDESSQVQFNKIRKDILDFINSLKENHLASFDKKGSDGKPDLYNGEVLYRIPKQMQKDEESKCLVRLAFDRDIITQDLELQEGDVMKDLRISEVMGVELLDPMNNAFEIRTLHDTVQFVEQDLVTEWIFYVKPISDGVHNLILKISIIEIKNGIERKRNVVLEEKVEIVSTVPKQATTEFANANIALAVAHGSQGSSVPSADVSADIPPQPSTKSSDAMVPVAPIVNPAPAPAPAPKPAPARSKRSFRKIAPALSAIAVIVLASVVVFQNSFTEDNKTHPGDVVDDNPSSGDFNYIPPPVPAACDCSTFSANMFNGVSTKNVKEIKRVGNHPEFGNLHNLDEAGFYNMLKGKYDNNPKDKIFLDQLFKQMGYANGFSEVDTKMFSTAQLSRGTVGYMGYNAAHQSYYGRLDASNEEDTQAFRINAKNGCTMHFMKTAGSHFFFCPN